MKHDSIVKKVMEFAKTRNKYHFLDSLIPIYDHEENTATDIDTLGIWVGRDSLIRIVIAEIKETESKSTKNKAIKQLYQGHHALINFLEKHNLNHCPITMLYIHSDHIHPSRMRGRFISNENIYLPHNEKHRDLHFSEQYDEILIRGIMPRVFH